MGDVKLSFKDEEISKSPEAVAWLKECEVILNARVWGLSDALRSTLNEELIYIGDDEDGN